MAYLPKIKHFALWALVAAALLFGPVPVTSTASADQNPIFGSAKVAALSVDSAKKITAKGYYGNLFGYYALQYLYQAYVYQYYAYYTDYRYGTGAYNYGSVGAQYAYYAWLYTKYGM